MVSVADYKERSFWLHETLPLIVSAVFVNMNVVDLKQKINLYYKKMQSFDFVSSFFMEGEMLYAKRNFNRIRRFKRWNRVYN